MDSDTELSKRMYRQGRPFRCPRWLHFKSRCKHCEKRGGKKGRLRFIFDGTSLICFKYKQTANTRPVVIVNCIITSTRSFRIALSSLPDDSKRYPSLKN